MINKRRLRQDWAEFLSGFLWDFAITLTFARATSTQGAVREFRHRFIRKLAWLAKGRTPFFCSVERTAAGVPHVHALVHGARSLRVSDVQGCWGLGLTRIVRYDPSRGAAAYFSKNLDDNKGWYDITRRMPPRRQDGGGTAE